MLRSGTLHCDPHPGNLLRTRDGRLCILDWGLVTTLDPDLQLTLIEHVAHLTAEDYARIPGDLVRLGFVPAGSEAAALEAGVVSLLTRAYRERAAGGGFARFDAWPLPRAPRARRRHAVGPLPDPAVLCVHRQVLLGARGHRASGRPRLLDPQRDAAVHLAPHRYRPVAAHRGRAAHLCLWRGADAARSTPTASLALTAWRASSSTTAAGGVDAERVADAVLDLLAQDTPAATLATEQLALARGRVSPAARRRALRHGAVDGRGAQRPLRARRGARPIGLFRGSALVNTDERDRAALGGGGLASDRERRRRRRGRADEAEQRRRRRAREAWSARCAAGLAAGARELLQRTPRA